MEFLSILNDVLGPVMRGPSSSHTAGSHHIARLLRDLLGDEPASAEFVFDRDGSYAQTYREQGVDLALAAGLLGWPITDERFPKALHLAPSHGLKISFRVERLQRASHPNTVLAALVSKGGKGLRARAESIGGGMVLVTEVDGRPVRIDGKSHELLVLLSEARQAREAERLASADGQSVGRASRSEMRGKILLEIKRRAPLGDEARAALERLEGVLRIRTAEPIFFLQKGPALFSSAAEMVLKARVRRLSLGGIALAYEAQVLGLPEDEIIHEALRRYALMRDAVRRGLAGQGVRMRLLEPSAGRILRSEARGNLVAGGLHARAAARAMAALHVSNSLGVVCAAPTGGSAGVLPGVLVTMAEERGLAGRRLALALLAAGGVGLAIARRATFAAEVAGCQVEIGAAGAMAAAACVEAAGGGPSQATEAAAIALQNTMGSVCDLVQGMCEIPCHTRNAAAAASAFVCADLVLGGYRNPIPLDETIDASFASGKMLPAELRCTAKGGLAMTPSARALRRLR